MASQGVRIGETHFRVDEISWVAVRRLTPWEQSARWGLMISGVLFFLLVAWAKGTFLNLEGLLGLLPLRSGLLIRGQYRVASSGDTDDSYQERNAQGLARPADLAEAMAVRGTGILELRSPRGDYYYVLRPERIAWLRPWTDLDLSPLTLTGLFGLYGVVATWAWRLAGGSGEAGNLSGASALLHDLRLLQFQARGPGPAILASGLVLGASLLAVVASYKRGVEVAAVGGLRETLPLHGEDRARIFREIVERDSQDEVAAVFGGR